MELVYKSGNILDTDDRIIAHQVNCMGRMGSGVAKALNDEFPELFEDYIEYLRTRQERVFGSCYIHIAHDRNSVCRSDHHTEPIIPIAIANLFGQRNYGRDGKQYTNYQALESALKQMRRSILYNRDYWYPNEQVRLSTVRLGCGLGGGSWDVVEPMIQDIFKNDIILITVWDYNG